MDLSIILPTYNVEKYLPKCLNSIFAQGLAEEEFEVIVVNDGSPDGSQAIAQDYADRHPNIVVVSQQNQGIAVARNTGLDVAKGDYIYMLDPDDYLRPNSLRHLMDIATKNDADVVLFKSKDVHEGVDDNPEDEQPCTGEGTTQVMTGLEADEKGLFPKMFTVWIGIYKRELLDRLHLRFMPELRNSEDTPFMLEALLNAQCVAVTDMVPHRYLQRNTSVRHAKTREARQNTITYDIKCCKALNDINQRWKGKRPVVGYQRTQSLIAVLMFFAILRMLKLRLPAKQVGDYLTEMQTHGLYPLGDFGEYGYNTLKYKALKALLNSRWRVLTLATLL